MAYEVPALPYDYAALEPHIDEQTMRIHHDKHHAAYVTNPEQRAGELAGAGEASRRAVDPATGQGAGERPHRRSEQRRRSRQPQLLLAHYGSQRWRRPQR